MKNTDYYKSGKLLTNVLMAREKALLQTQLNKSARIEKYLQSPALCANCNRPIAYDKKKNKFCSKSCAATFNNIRKPPRSQESKDKTSKALSNRTDIKRTHGNGGKVSGFCKIQWNTCGHCNKIFYTKGWSNSRKSCGSLECKVHLSVGNRTYRNGRRKLFHYFNKHQNREVLLESTWEYEMAQWLDQENITWERPSYIKWYDERSQKHRLYYPDFYLPELRLYLDPKNPTSMRIEQYKMTTVSGLIPLVYGDLNLIKDQILVMVSPESHDLPTSGSQSQRSAT
jgi:hypothetical protein